MMNIHCIPYEAVMSLTVCESRKKAATAGDGLTNRKCIDCKEGGNMPEEKKEVLYCKPCGTEIKAGEKYFKNTGECKKCYQARWLREKKAKGTLAPPEAATPVKPAPVRKVILKPANGSGAIEKLDKEISRIDLVITDLENQLEAHKYKLSVVKEVRGMLG